MQHCMPAAQYAHQSNALHSSTVSTAQQTVQRSRACCDNCSPWSLTQCRLACYLQRNTVHCNSVSIHQATCKWVEVFLTQLCFMYAKRRGLAHHGKSYKRQDCSGLCNDLSVRGEKRYQLTLQVHTPHLAVTEGPQMNAVQRVCEFCLLSIASHLQVGLAVHQLMTVTATCIDNLTTCWQEAKGRMNTHAGDEHTLQRHITGHRMHSVLGGRVAMRKLNSLTPRFDSLPFCLRASG